MIKDDNDTAIDPIGCGLSSGTIECYLGRFLTAAKMVKKLIKWNAIFKTKVIAFTNDDEKCHAQIFKNPTNTVAIHNTLIIDKSEILWPTIRKIEIWMSSLLTCGIIGCASNATEFCQIFEDIKFPPKTSWDKDGLLPNISFIFYDWKWNYTASYYLKYAIDRNKVDWHFNIVYHFF